MTVKSYLISVFILSLILLVVHSIAEHTKSLQGYVRLLSGLVCVLVIFSPILSLIEDLADGFTLSEDLFPEQSVVYDDSVLIVESERRIAKSIKETLGDQFNTEISGVSVDLDYDLENSVFTLRRITVYLIDASFSQRIKVYLQSEYSCEIIMMIGGEKSEKAV